MPLFQIGDNFFASFVTVLSLIDSAVLVDHSMAIHDRDNFQIMALSHGKVSWDRSRG